MANFIIKQNACELADLICEITGVEYTAMKKSQRETIIKSRQVKPEPDPIHFVHTPIYNDSSVQSICEFFTNLMKFIAGDASDVLSDWGEGDGSKDSSKKKKAVKKKKRGDSSDAKDSSDEDSDGGANCDDPIIVCIDNAHLMDATSWKLLGELSQEDLKVAFYLIIKYDYRDRLLIVPEAKKAFDEAWEQI